MFFQNSVVKYICWLTIKSVFNCVSIIFRFMFRRKSRTAVADKYQVLKSVITMPNKAISHTENRAKVCLLCFQKG